MSSYYNRIEGTLNTGLTARSSDIHVIQSEIQDAIQQALIDIHGTGVVLGEEEDALKLEPTTQHVDQSNTNFDDEHQGLSCYEVYFRQPIDIEKSSIESIRLEMLNNSNVEVTVYAEIQDANFNVIGESNAILKITDPNTYEPIEFTFSKNHLPLGRYYFVLRPVDISSVDLAINGDETIYDTINPSMFKVKYDSEGTYSNPTENEIVFYEDTYGLEASYDGNEFLEARYLEEAWIESDVGTAIAEKNFDLYFEHIFSSGNTYLINNGAAIVLGEKVYPLDTHVTIDGPSIHGDRTDLVILTTDGQLNVIKGTVYNGEKIYPTDNSGLKIAYITTYKYGLTEDEKANILSGNTTLSEIENQAYNRKVPSIEQDDEDNITRQRDILERLRRLEKKITYQQNNNAPTRIKYNCTIDPVLANNGVNEDASIRGEGSYGLTEGHSSDGSIALVTGKSQTYSWSIIDKKYSYNYTTESSTVKGNLTITDVHMPLSKPPGNSILSCMKCEIILEAPGYYQSDNNNSQQSVNTSKEIGGVPYAKIDITIKKGSNTIDTYNIKTDSNGAYTLSLWNTKKLKEGTYKIYAQYNGKTVQSTMKVYSNNHNFSDITVKKHTTSVDVQTVTAAQATQTLTPTSTFFVGDDSFYKDKVDIDTDIGEVTIKRIGDTGEYEQNKLLKDVNVFSSSERVYKLKNDKTSLTSEYPVLNFTLESDTHIKEVTPYVTKFKNLDKFRIIIFKNDFIFDNTKNARKIIQKKITKKDNIFPTVYDSGWKSLSSAVTAGDGYKKLKTPVTFSVNNDFTAGTYSLVVCGHIDSKNTEGAIKILEYVTRDYKKEYGVATKCTGGSQLSIINMDINNITNRSWDLLIKQRPYKYYGSGILISKPIDTLSNIKECIVGEKSRNFSIPNGCNIKLYVSNNGGTSWVNADSGNVTFDGNGHSFRWKLEMTSNSTSTPKLYFNQVRKSAISFNLTESSTYVPYEDYQKCYETPLLNANAITRSFIGNDLVTNRFSEWEFARLYMEDDELESKIDILFSYDDNDTSTNVLTDKSKWGNNIFFNQIFADLSLDDFSRDSVDYDNYDGNVEYDEYNYRFKMDSEYVMEYTGENALASPDIYFEQGTSAPYEYGDISATDEEGIPLNDIHNIFEYTYIDNKYQYKDNEDDSTKRYAGMHIVDGPMWQATLKNTTSEYSSDDVIIGIKFNDILDVTENMTHITLGLTPVIQTAESTSTTEQLFFPPGTFDVVVAINRHGEVDDLDATNGKAYIIDTKLIANEYNEVTIDFLDDLNGFEASGIGSIGIRIRDPANFNEGDGIQLGRITTNSYNIRPYVPYMHTGKWDRLAWQTLSDECKAYSMYILGRKDAETSLTLRAFYPITNIDKDAIKNEIIFDQIDGISATYTMDIQGTTTELTIPSDNLVNRGHCLYAWNNKKTAKTDNALFSKDKTIIIRDGHEISTKITRNNGTVDTFVTKDSGNQTLFYLPPNKTGTLFKIDTNIPYTIYDLIDIEYYILTTYQIEDEVNINSSKNTNIQTHNENGTNYTYHTHGSFSKGDIYINFYDTRDIEGASPIESFPLPAWGRIQTSSYVENKIVHSWFKKRSDAVTIKAITIERRNPRQHEQGANSVSVDEIYLMINNILLFNAETEAALGPQMQMRIYPNATSKIGNNTAIRKVGGIYRI